MTLNSNFIFLTIEFMNVKFAIFFNMIILINDSIIFINVFVFEVFYSIALSSIFIRLVFSTNTRYLSGFISMGYTVIFIFASFIVCIISLNSYNNF